MNPLPAAVRLAPPDLLSLGLLGMRTRPVRAALSAVGIAIGIATMVVVTAIPASGQRALLDELTALGTNLLQATVPPERQGQPSAELPIESVDMVSRIGPVTVASAVANTHATVSRSDRDVGEDVTGIAVLASKLNLLTAINATVQSGRFLDLATTAFPTVVLGSVAASRLGYADLPEDLPAPQVYINNRWFTVIGILDPTPLSPDIDRAVLVSWPAAQAQLRFDGHPTVIYVQAHESRIEAVRAVLPPTINPASPSMVAVTRPSDALAAKRATQNTFSALFLGLAGVALLVGGIGVANTMVVSVLERRREIGLRRALGASRGQIRAQFLTESVILAVLGGVIGVVLGALATVAYTAYQHWPAVLSVAVAADGLGGTALIGMIAGAYPAIRAARLTPTEALAS
jgi:putative ABC transport system permease protein